MLAPHLQADQVPDTAMFSVLSLVAHDLARLRQEMASLPNAEVVCSGQLVSAFSNGR